MLEGGCPCVVESPRGAVREKGIGRPIRSENRCFRRFSEGDFRAVIRRIISTHDGIGDCQDRTEFEPARPHPVGAATTAFGGEKLGVADQPLQSLAARKWAAALLLYQPALEAYRDYLLVSLKPLSVKCICPIFGAAPHDRSTSVLTIE